MMRKILLYTLFAFFLVSKSHAQQVLNGDTIFVNNETPVTLKFPTNIYTVLVKDSLSYTILKIKNKITIKTTSKDVKCTNAIIDEESKRNHLITLCYKAEIKLDTENEDIYDFSTVKKLESFINTANAKKTLALARANTAPPQITSTVPTQTTIVQNENKLKIDGLLKAGNDAYRIEDWATANDKYKQVLQLDLKNEAAKKGLKDIVDVRNRKIKQHIELGNNAEINKQYDVAINEYNEVLKLDPANDFVIKEKVKINASIKKGQDEDMANKKRQEQLKKQNELDALRSDALKLFGEKKYDLSIMAYNKVLAIDENDKISKNKIDEIKKIKQQDEIYEKQKNNDGKFNKLIEDGDKAFANNEFELAKSIYASAKEIKTTDQSVAQKIQSTNKKIENKEKEEKYQTAINIADDAKKAGEYEKAKEQYNIALAIFKNRTYPADQIVEINTIITKNNNDKKRDRDYQTAISKGDEAFNSNDWVAAKTLYSSAIKLKDEEEYPQLKLVEIKNATELQEQRKKEKEDSAAKNKEFILAYQGAMNKGKAAEAKLNYVAAKNAYIEAYQLKQNDEVLNKKIEEINKKLNLNKNDDIYDSLMQKGNIEVVDNSNYTLAIDYFNKAQLLKPSDIYPLKQINWVKEIMAKDSIRNAQEDERRRIEIYNLQYEVQQKRAREAIEAYSKYEDASQTADLEKEVYYLKIYLNLVPNDSMYNKYFSNKQYTKNKNYARDKLADIRQYWARTKGSFYQSDVDSIPYLSQDLDKKYQNISLTSVKEEQEMTLIDTVSMLETLNITKAFSWEPSRLNLSDSSENAKLTVENFNFKKGKTYVRFKVKNSETTDFITGTMYLNIQKKDGTVIKNKPDYISSKPIILPGKEFTIFYSAKEVNLDEGDSLFFELTNPLMQKKLRVNIASEVYKNEQNRK